ncbi:NUDIX hydrolase domain protein [Pseudocohnilembus persalinus]|uniref:NUDIX hydrolase domain protein n=1 Tax=Pseudocohnilembus persalinus TaxID=266149 RepID=A0A0V0R340_PSEPJ|nr:NUDIX hydrolase domain protein [Pseudocohnilembus persalinus]|eukprot:KRX08930.1 NUDIX hydrolase domain protein [Pseudocohnilembus persalinus]
MSKNIPKLGISVLALNSFKNPELCLLIKREGKAYKGLWSLPGGHLEFGETVNEAMLRELKEETGYRGKMCTNNNYYVSDVILKKDQIPQQHYLLITGICQVNFENIDFNHENIHQQVFSLEKFNQQIPLKQQENQINQKHQQKIIQLTDLQTKDCTPNLFKVIEHLLIRNQAYTQEN